MRRRDGRAIRRDRSLALAVLAAVNGLLAAPVMAGVGVGAAAVAGGLVEAAQAAEPREAPEAPTLLPRCRLGTDALPLGALLSCPRAERGSV